MTHIAVSANGVFVSTANQVHWFSSTLQQLGDPLVSLGCTVNGIASTSDGEWCVVCTDMYCRCTVLMFPLNDITGHEWTLVCIWSYCLRINSS